ncbi:hypothetical protein BDZ89DRAFT_1138559 [Hymenopellis radicata]|nr:hypothetical protein BDZ89DRAFT_1138559 [Hymenopellis radicata]
MASAPKPAVNSAFWNDKLFHNAAFQKFYHLLHGAPRELYDIIYHLTWGVLDECQRLDVYGDGQYSALLYSIARAMCRPLIAKGLCPEQVATFMRDVSDAEARYSVKYAPEVGVASTNDADSIRVERYKPGHRVYTFANIVVLDIDLGLCRDFRTVHPIRYLMLLDLTLRYHFNAGAEMTSFLQYLNHKDCVLRRLRLIALPVLCYEHDPANIYWDHPAFRRAIRGFVVLTTFAMTHPAYLVPFRKPCWIRDFYTNDQDDIDDEEGEDEHDEVDDDEDVEQTQGNGEGNDEAIFQARQRIRYTQEANHGWRRAKWVLEDADWASGEMALVEDLASSTLRSIFFVYAYDEDSKVEGDFSLDEVATPINGRFSHFIRNEQGTWVQRQNNLMLRADDEDEPDLKLDGMMFAEDCWSGLEPGTKTLI